ncbi:hypothetical protein L3V83_15750 [Thiotrichales bacterium 19X7-9]|nr:hypothetical protein [Thiotrichales bacterium 19X7-9]
MVFNQQEMEKSQKTAIQKYINQLKDPSCDFVKIFQESKDAISKHRKLALGTKKNTKSYQAAKVDFDNAQKLIDSYSDKKVKNREIDPRQSAISAIFDTNNPHDKSRPDVETTKKPIKTHKTESSTLKKASDTKHLFMEQSQKDKDVNPVFSHDFYNL